MDQKKNPVLDFNWECDIKYAGVPQSFIPDQWLAECTQDGKQQIIKRAGHYLLQADPNDYLELEMGAAPKTRYHAHAKIWKDTVDQYIFQYACLMDAWSEKANLDKWEELAFPESIMTKYENHMKRYAKGKAKPLAVKPVFLKKFEATESVEIQGEGYRTPSVGKGIYLHQLCRGLDTSTTADKKLFSLQYDGLKFRAKNEDDFIPDFELEEYWLHEHNTGISLSIEIAAVLLEVMKKCPAQEMWDNAFDEFCEKVLPLVVRSPYCFTRNAVARYFFQQIQMDSVVKSYQWNEDEKSHELMEADWAERIQYAAYHSQVLTMMPFLAEVPEEQLEAALSHLRKLLSAVKAPVNIMEYIEQPTHGLAFFCNPDHEYVSFFLDELEKQSIGDKAQKQQKDRHRGKADNPYKVFEKVRKAVKEAIVKANNPPKKKDVSERKENEIG